MAIDLLGYIEKLKAASTPEAKFSVFAETVAGLGLNQTLYGFSIADGERAVAENARIFSNFRLDYLETYEAEGHADHDVSVRHCTVSDRPARWFDPVTERAMTESERAVDDVARDFGFRAGLTIPAREGAESLFGGISLATADMGVAEFEKILRENQPKLHLMALYLHAEIQRVLEPGADLELTPREQEVLLWAALGHSSKETAQRLGIAFRTVEYHLESARNKLGANNKVHTVAKAIARGLVKI